MMMDDEVIDNTETDILETQGNVIKIDEATGIAQLATDADGNATLVSGLSQEPQYIIVTPNEAGGAGDGHLEPGAKRLKLEPGDVQTFVLSVSGDGKQFIEPRMLEDGDMLLPQSPVILHQEDSQDACSSDSGGRKGNGSDVTQTWFTTKDDKLSYHSKGCNWKQGQWSREEVELLQTNITAYCVGRGIPDPAEIIFEMSKDERKDFYRTVAKGLQRPLFSVYRRVIRMYDNRNHIGKYSSEELQKLKELRLTHGTDWASIGAVLGRSASSVKDRCRLMRETCNSGKWLPEEERRLENAVYELSGCTPGEDVISGLSWAQVAERVSTRSEKQCRTKWLNYLNWKSRGGKEWTREDEITLVMKIMNLKVDDENQINWSDLCRDWSSARSPQWLRGKWWSLKRHVPDYQNRCFTDIVDYLRSMHTQNIRVKAPSAQTKSPNQVDLNKLNITHMFVPVQEDGSVVGAIGDEDSDGGVGAVNTYEAVLQSLASSAGSQGTFLITQPQNSSGLTAGSLGTDHIIVHTLPVSQFQGNENVTVQTIPQSQVIISTVPDQVSDEEVTTLQLEGAITDPESLQTLTVTDGIEGEIIAAPDTYQVQTIGVADINGDVSQSPLDVTEGTINCTMTEVSQSDLEQNVPVTGDLVLVSSASPQFVSTGAANLIHMSSLADPMLTSEALIGSCSDMETDKVQGHDIEGEHEDVGSPS